MLHLASFNIYTDPLQQGSVTLTQQQGNLRNSLDRTSLCGFFIHTDHIMTATCLRQTNEKKKKMKQNKCSQSFMQVITNIVMMISLSLIESLLCFWLVSEK